jgi:hypothetical protein
MAIGRNPNEPPQSDPVKDEAARQAGLKRVQIVCDTPEGQPDDPDMPPITFFAYTDFIPRKDEILLLQDGKRVQVQYVYYKIVNTGPAQLTLLVPWVYATLVRNEQGP